MIFQKSQSKQTAKKVNFIDGVVGDLTEADLSLVVGGTVAYPCIFLSNRFSDAAGKKSVRDCLARAQQI